MRCILKTLSSKSIKRYKTSYKSLLLDSNENNLSLNNHDTSTNLRFGQNIARFDSNRRRAYRKLKELRTKQLGLRNINKSYIFCLNKDFFEDYSGFCGFIYLKNKHKHVNAFGNPIRGEYLIEPSLEDLSR